MKRKLRVKQWEENQTNAKKKAILGIYVQWMGDWMEIIKVKEPIDHKKKGWNSLIWKTLSSWRMIDIRAVSQHLH